MMSASLADESLSIVVRSERVPWGSTGALVDNAAMSTILVELDRVAGCAERTPVLDTTSRLADDFILSGTDVGGRRLWRLSLNASSNALRQQGRALAVGVNLGAPLPGGAAWALSLIHI